MIQIRVKEDSNDMRLDRFLKENLNLTHGLICKYLRSGLIKLNNKKSDFNVKINQNDVISVVDFVMKNFKHLTANKEKPTDKMIKMISNAIEYEDKDILVLNKPYGISVQGGDGINFAIIDILTYINSSYKMVHRLDKDTTGVMLFAKNRQTSIILSSDFKNRFIKKTYIAILQGEVREKCGIIKTRIKKVEVRDNESFARNCEDGDIAISEFETLGVSDDKKYSLVKFIPVTGRIHQIRLHALHLGCPVLGDIKYNSRYQKNDKLHLVSIDIKLPEDRNFHIKKIPEHIKDFMDKFFSKINI